MPRPEAVADLESALEELRRQEVEGILSAGNAHMEQGDTDAAEADFRRALEIDPNRAGAHVRLADAHRARGRYNEAIDGYDRALQLKPEWDAEVWFHMRLAHVFRESGQFEKAVTEYELVLAMDPDHQAAAKWLDELLKQRSHLRSRKADRQRVTSWRSGLRIAPSHAGV
jgi:tetratricopeptide (TPR) repeat protein